MYSQLVRDEWHQIAKEKLGQARTASNNGAWVDFELLSRL